MLVAMSAPAANAGWTRPSVLVTGDDAAFLGSVARPDGSLRAAIMDSGRGIALGFADGGDGAVFGDPLVALRSPAKVGYVAFAADGSGVGLEYPRDAPSQVVAFDAAGTVLPLMTLDDAGHGPALAISPAGTAVVAWLAKSEQGYEVDAAFRDPGSATFGAPVRAGYTTTSHTIVSAGIGDNGEAVVTWQTNGFPSDLAAAVRLPGSAFSKARFVRRDAGEVQLAVGPGGQAILATTRGAALDVSIKPPGGDTIPAPERVDRGQGFAIGVAAAGARAVAAAWVVAPKSRKPAQVRVYEGGERLTRVGTVGRDALGENVELAIDGAGVTAVAWEEGLKFKRGQTNARAHLGVAYRSAGARLRAVRYFGPVSLDDTPEAVRLGPGGRAWVTYEAFQTSDSGDGRGYRRVYVTERTP
jgi:hypothetical protein